MLIPTGVYTLILPRTTLASTAVRTLCQINAPATRVLVIYRWWISQTVSETSTQEESQLIRVTTAGTGTSTTARPVGAYAAAASTCTTNHTAEATLGDELDAEGWNILNGVHRIYVPEDRPVVPPSGRVALRIPATLTAALTVSAGITFAELG